MLKKWITTFFNFTSRFICELMLVICLCVSGHYQLTNGKCDNAIRSDGIGYYSYLPATFIYHDYSYAFIGKVQKEHPGINFSDTFLTATNKGTTNKYFIGVSILLLPFFLVAHLLSYLFRFPPDGYSFFYQLFVLLAANIYFYLGCRFTRKLILQYPVSPGTAAFIMVITVFATNLFFYASGDPSYSHIYSFAAIAMLLYYSGMFFKTRSTKHLYISAVLFALVVLLRPTNVVVVLLFPFLAGSVGAFADAVKTLEKPGIIFAAILLVCILFLQPLTYYLETGCFFIWSYGKERFYFTDPQLYNILLGYKKGLFVYTPLALFSLAGFFYVFKTNKFRFWSLLLFVFISAYIIASWSCWWYGASLSQRAFVDFYSVLALLLTFLFMSLKKQFLKTVYYFFSLLCLGYSLVLTYQYRHQIIHFDAMTKQKFWFTFLKTDAYYQGIIYSEALFSDKVPTNIVVIKTSNGKYLSSARNENSSMQATADKPMSWETFNLISLPGNKVAIMSDDGTYFSNILDKQNILTHAAKSINEWEQFELVKIDENTVALKGCNNKYAVLKGGQLFVCADKPEDAEKLQIIKK